MRLRWALPILLVAGCGGSGSNPTELLPDLVQSPPRALQAYRSGENWRLTFLSAVENDGRGPMLVVGRRPDRATPAMSVEQLVRRSDESTASYEVKGAIRFVESETHRHWHFLGFERYDILTPVGASIGRDEKTGFCLGDRYDAFLRAYTTHLGEVLPDETPYFYTYKRVLIWGSTRRRRRRYSSTNSSNRSGGSSAW